jgi:hypothetical protein
MGKLLDVWADKSTFCCATCQWFAAKERAGQDQLGRCRRHAPTLGGYPVVYALRDWCGDHKLGEPPRP